MKIMVIGNIASGKTCLSRKLARIHQLPLIHIDSLQFLPGLKMRPRLETQVLIDRVTEQDHWLIDGFGPLDKIEARFELADLIIFIDFPLWRNRWWLARRQVMNIFRQRSELPENCRELSLDHTLRLYRSMNGIHLKMRPELLRILGNQGNKSKVIQIRDLEALRSISQSGVY